jgi:hypothetical protein
MKTKLITFVCLLAFCFAATNSTFAQTRPDPAAVVADVVIVRPVCFVATVVGSVFFVVSLPISAIAKSVKTTADVLVVSPAKATFTRPMGDLDALMDY